MRVCALGGGDVPGRAFDVGSIDVPGAATVLARWLDCQLAWVAGTWSSCCPGSSSRMSRSTLSTYRHAGGTGWCAVDNLDFA